MRPISENVVLTNRIDQIVGTHVAFVGGGAFCRELLDFFLEAPADAGPPTVLAVADPNPDAPGARATV